MGCRWSKVCETPMELRPYPSSFNFFTFRLGLTRRKRQFQPPESNGVPTGFRNGFYLGNHDDVDENFVQLRPALSTSIFADGRQPADQRQNGFGHIYVTPYHWVTTTIPTEVPIVTTYSSTVSKIATTSQSSSTAHSIVPIRAEIFPSTSATDPCSHHDSQSIASWNQRRLDIGRYPSFNGPQLKPNCKDKEQTNPTTTRVSYQTTMERQSPRVITFPTDSTSTGKTVDRTNLIRTSRPPAFALAPSMGEDDKFAGESSLHPEGISYSDEYFKAAEWRSKKSHPRVVVINDPIVTTAATGKSSSIASIVISTTTKLPVPLGGSNIINDQSPPSEWAINTGRASIG